MDLQPNWLGRNHPDREKIIYEIHRRTPLPIGPIARVSHVVFVYPTKEDAILKDDRGLEPHKLIEKLINTDSERLEYGLTEEDEFDAKKIPK